MHGHEYLSHHKNSRNQRAMNLGIFGIILIPFDNVYSAEQQLIYTRVGIRRKLVLFIMHQSKRMVPLIYIPLYPFRDRGILLTSCRHVATLRTLHYDCWSQYRVTRFNGLAPDCSNSSALADARLSLVKTANYMLFLKVFSSKLALSPTTIFLWLGQLMNKISIFYSTHCQINAMSLRCTDVIVMILNQTGLWAIEIGSLAWLFNDVFFEITSDRLISPKCVVNNDTFFLSQLINYGTILKETIYLI